MTDDEVISEVRREARRVYPSNARPPLAVEAVPEIEAEIGLVLPLLLVRVYVEVADGGIGNGYGMLPLKQASAIYRSYRDDPYAPADDQWPRGLLPILHYGCGVFDCIDCLTPGAPVSQFEPNAQPPDQIFFRQADSLARWLVDGCGYGLRM